MFALLQLLLLAVAARGAYDPSPPNWGGNATTFAWGAQVDMPVIMIRLFSYIVGFSFPHIYFHDRTDISDAPTHPKWQFAYYYNYKIKASRYDHAQGQHDEVCALAGIVGDPCTVLNAADGNLYLSGAASCCICKAQWAPFTIKPDWLARSNATYIGRSSISGQRADGWLAYGASDNHYYATTDPSRMPIRFMEHKNGKLKEWDISGWTPGAPPTDKFSTPPNCNTLCPASICK